MPSWREGVSQLAQDDVDALVNATLEFATHQLGERTSLYPFGASISVDGEMTMLAAGIDSEHDTLEVLQLLLHDVRTQSADLRATALVADVLANGRDAIRVELEHREGVAIAVLLPYKTHRFGRGPTYGELVTQLGTRQVWAPSA